MLVKNIKIKTYVLGFLPVVVIFICVIFVMLFYDRAVVYSVNTNNTYTVAEFLEQKKSFKLKYNNLYDIPSGEYIIKLFDDKIYVLDENEERVYIVKAKVSDFSLNDKNVLSRGIQAKSQKELFELIEYMES